MREIIVAAAVMLGGCGVVSEASSLNALGTDEQALSADNGISSNGISSNGISSNGISSNGISSNGLSTPQFATWFNSNRVGNDVVMSYLVRCALPAGSTRTFTDSAGTTHTWSGGLGLTPSWAAGSPATAIEQQLITACLAAHVNKYGKHVAFSIMGRGASGVAITLVNGLEKFAMDRIATMVTAIEGEQKRRAGDTDRIPQITKALEDGHKAQEEQLKRLDSALGKLRRALGS